MKGSAIVLSDANGHSPTWYEEDEEDHRGKVISEIIDQSDSIIIHENIATRLPFNRGLNERQSHSPGHTHHPNRLSHQRTMGDHNQDGLRSLTDHHNN